MEVEIRGLNVGSVVKVAFVIYAVVGLLAGIVYLIAAVVFSGLFDHGFGAGGTWIGRTAAAGLGILMIPLLALLYGFIGALGGLIFALLYNVICRAIGGVKVRLSGGVPEAGSMDKI
jgi:hypothetical protein